MKINNQKPHPPDALYWPLLSATVPCCLPLGLGIRILAVLSSFCIFLNVHGWAHSAAWAAQAAVNDKKYQKKYKN